MHSSTFRPATYMYEQKYLMDFKEPNIGFEGYAERISDFLMLNFTKVTSRVSVRYFLLC